MKFIHNSPNDTYCAPIIANGTIALQIAPDGSMNPDDTGKLIMSNIGRSIWWEGKRTQSIQTKPLIPFGYFTQTLSGLILVESEQELDCDNGEIVCQTEYSDGSKLKTTAFVCANDNLVVIRKSFVPNTEFTYEFKYSLTKCGEKNKFFETSAHENRIVWNALDQDNCSGTVAVFSDAECALANTEDSVTLSLKIDKECSMTFYILLSESRNVNIPNVDFAALQTEHRLYMQDFYSKGYIITGCEKLDRVYKTALYHLKSYATPWSMPVGLSDSCWNGRFFAFDEHYMLQGLLAANHMEEAMRIPVFRKNGLNIAICRASAKEKQYAHYPWETIEDGTEASPPGFYYDHIFHMAMIAISEYEYYKYKLDVDFLRETALPVIEACAKFYLDQSIYRDGEKLYIGKCTDLERLGAGVENAYMTTCSVIKTLEVYAQTLEILGIEPQNAENCRFVAEKLMASLPNDGKRYIPYPGCEDRSISVLSGVYPFDVIDRESKLQTAAIDDYLEHENTFGNMYSIGHGVCSWYSCWKSVVFSRLGRRDEALAALEYVADTCGDFGELFEINNRESKTYCRPWFTTAAGMYVHALNELFVRYEEDGLHIAEGLKFDSFSFKRAVRNGLTVEMKVENRRLIDLKIEKNKNCRLDEVVVYLPENLGGKMKITTI